MKIDTYECNSCGASVKKGAEQCTYCGSYLSWEKIELFNKFINNSETIFNAGFMKTVNLSATVPKNNVEFYPSVVLPDNPLDGQKTEKSGRFARCEVNLDTMLKMGYTSVEAVILSISRPVDILPSITNRANTLLKTAKQRMREGDDRDFMQGIKDGKWNLEGKLIDTRKEFKNNIVNSHFGKTFDFDNVYLSEVRGVFVNPITRILEHFNTIIGGELHHEEANIVCPSCGLNSILEKCEKCGMNKEGFVFEKICRTLYKKIEVIVRVREKDNRIVFQFSGHIDIRNVRELEHSVIPDILESGKLQEVRVPVHEIKEHFFKNKKLFIERIEERQIVVTGRVSYISKSPRESNDYYCHGYIVLVDDDTFSEIPVMIPKHIWFFNHCDEIRLSQKVTVFGTIFPKRKWDKERRRVVDGPVTEVLMGSTGIYVHDRLAIVDEMLEMMPEQ